MEFSDGLDLLEGSLITGLPLGGQEVAPELGGEPLERLFVGVGIQEPLRKRGLAEALPHGAELEVLGVRAGERARATVLPWPNCAWFAASMTTTRPPNLSNTSS